MRTYTPRPYTGPGRRQNLLKLAAEMTGEFIIITIFLAAVMFLFKIIG